MGRRGTPTAQRLDPSDDLASRTAREIRRQLSKKSISFFAATYLRDEDGEPFIFKDFHIEMMETAASEQEQDIEVVFLIPAANGKTTILSFIYPLWLLCVKNPNARLAIIGKTFEDAKARLRAIKTQMENNDLLIEDFGPFVTDRWTDDEINVAQRTTNAKDPSIKIFGSGMSVFGWRATDVVCDDIVTIQNSGSNVREETRHALADNYKQGIRKMGGPDKRKKVRIRWAQTVVDLRDLVHEVADIKSHTDEETHWVTAHGVKVIRHRALDEQTGEVLWPEMYTREDLEAERAKDVVAFLRRMQNRCIEPAMMTFQREWFDGNGADLPGCFDKSRSLGEMPKLEHVTFTTAAGYDPNFGLSDRAKWCGWVTLAFDKTAAEPRAYHVVEIARFRTGVEEQADFVINGHRRIKSALTLVERNGANQWLINLKAVQDFVKSGNRVEPHWTSEVNKPDPDVGLPSMSGVVKGGLLRIPYGDERSREMAELLVSEMVMHPMALTSDLLMALWFAILAARRVARVNRLAVVRRALPGWAQGFRGPIPQSREVVRRAS